MSTIKKGSRSTSHEMSHENVSSTQHDLISRSHHPVKRHPPAFKSHVSATDLKKTTALNGSHKSLLPPGRRCCPKQRHAAEPEFLRLPAKRKSRGQGLREVHLRLGAAAAIGLRIALVWGFKRQGYNSFQESNREDGSITLPRRQIHLVDQGRAS